MFVLANGAFKSGSSWLLAIIKEIKTFENVPQEYCDPVYPTWAHWLDQRKMKAFFEAGFQNSNDKNYISKGHVYGTKIRQLLLSYENVFVFDITRDLKDVIVSHYYHTKRIRNINWDFKTFYWRLGRYKAYQIVDYHRTWHEPHPRIFLSAFENLKNDFHDEVERIGNFLGVSLTVAEVEGIKQRTSLENLRQRAKEETKDADKRFYRKGAIGDWQQYFDDEMLEDIEKISTGSLRPADKLIYHAMFTVRPAVRDWYVKDIKPRLTSQRILQKN